MVLRPRAPPPMPGSWGLPDPSSFQPRAPSPPKAGPLQSFVTSASTARSLAPHLLRNQAQPHCRGKEAGLTETLSHLKGPAQTSSHWSHLVRGGGWTLITLKDPKWPSWRLVIGQLGCRPPSTKVLSGPCSSHPSIIQGHLPSMAPPHPPSSQQPLRGHFPSPPLPCWSRIWTRRPSIPRCAVSQVWDRPPSPYSSVTCSLLRGTTSATEPASVPSHQDQRVWKEAGVQGGKAPPSKGFQELDGPSTAHWADAHAGVCVPVCVCTPGNKSGPLGEACSLAAY